MNQKDMQRLKRTLLKQLEEMFNEPSVRVTLDNKLDHQTHQSHGYKITIETGD
jgi:hypothetical protein